MNKICSNEMGSSRSMNIAEDYVWRKSDCTKDNLNGRLARFCKKHLKEMAFFPLSIAKTKYNCKDQFRFRRWDCTTIDKSHFGVDLREGMSFHACSYK